MSVLYLVLSEASESHAQYYEVPGTGTIVPVLSLDDQLKNMSLRGKPATKDPIAVATMNGRAPTLREVKESLRVSKQSTRCNCRSTEDPMT